jgi:hypothetical protein
VHPDAEVANARLTDDAGDPKVSLHGKREMSEVCLGDGRG